MLCTVYKSDIVLFFLINVSSSRKNPYPPHGRSMEIPRGRGVLKAKIIEAKYEAKLKFLRVVGMQNKNLLWEECEYFLEQHNDGCTKLKHQ